MGTNFYLLTKDREKREKWFEFNEFSLTDTPDWGYEIHIAKTSCGWRPLFEDHKLVHSVAMIKKIYDEGGFQIVDEYGQYYTWDEFQERVLNFNRDNPEALSHPDYEDGRYRSQYFTDHEGYEFSTFGPFC